MELLNYIKDVELVGKNRFMVTFVDNSTMEIACDRYFWYAISRSGGYVLDVSLVEVQRIDFYKLRNTYGKEA